MSDQYPPYPAEGPSQHRDEPAPTGGPTVVQPRRRRLTGLWVALSVVLLAAICSGVLVIRYTLPLHRERTAHVAAPDAIGELTRSTDPQDLANVAILKSALSQSARDVVAALYSDSANSVREVAVVAGTGVIDDPASVADDLLKGPVDQGTLINVRTVDPGALSGTARCGDGSTDKGVTLELCSWADHGSLGLVVMLGWDHAAVEDLFRQVRAAVLTRG